MSNELYSMAYLTKEQREEIELLEMKACMALLDDQIVQLHRFKQFHSDLDQPRKMDEHAQEFAELMASVEQSTSLARQLNARAVLTVSQRASSRLFQQQKTTQTH